MKKNHLILSSLSLAFITTGILPGCKYFVAKPQTVEKKSDETDAANTDKVNSADKINNADNANNSDSSRSAKPSILYKIDNILPGEQECEHGGIIIWVGEDTNLDSVLSKDEQTNEFINCSHKTVETDQDEERLDTDKDGIMDFADFCPLDPDTPSYWFRDKDQDGLGNSEDKKLFCTSDAAQGYVNNQDDLNDDDFDNDGFSTADDNCPNIANPNQSDYKENGVGDICDPASLWVFINKGNDSTTYKHKASNKTYLFKNGLRSVNNVTISTECGYLNFSNVTSNVPSEVSEISTPQISENSIGNLQGLKLFHGYRPYGGPDHPSLTFYKIWPTDTVLSSEDNTGYKVICIN